VAGLSDTQYAYWLAGTAVSSARSLSSSVSMVGTERPYTRASSADSLGTGRAYVGGHPTPAPRCWEFVEVLDADTCVDPDARIPLRVAFECEGSRIGGKT
jgi:hypothetical protein